MAGIYIHVPYCKTRCIYCDFFSQTNTSSKSEYVVALGKEILLRKNYIGVTPIKSIYFGGGTPSQLSTSELQYIFAAIYANFDVDESAEVTIEANPDDLSEKYISQLRALPFNRLSIGVQSFDDNELKFLNRRHSAQTAKDVVARCQDVGFDNISIDLMYGLPNQTIDIWKKNLEKAIELNVQHISSYHLIYEEGTQLYDLLGQGKVESMFDELSVEMFSTMIDKLSVAGFEHYEISNFAKHSIYSQHNSSYWLGHKYLGLGPSSHSYDGQNRAWNVASISDYINGINTKRPNIVVEKLDNKTKYNDFIITGMRTKWGINLSNLEQMFGTELLNYCLQNIKKHIDRECVINSNNTLILTRKGIFVSDDIMSDLMFVD